MKLKKVLATVMSIALFAAALTGCGSSDTSGSFNDGYADNVFRVAIASDIETADVQLSTADYTLPINLYDTLVEVKTLDDGTSEIEGSLAEDWEISDDGLVYTFHLRQGVLFSNGEELEADDVLYTIDRMANPERLAKNTDCMDMIKGVQDMLDGKIDTVEGVGVEIIDKYTVAITLEQAYAPFLANLCVPGFSIYNREAGDAADEAGDGIQSSKFGVDPEYTVGTGPFTLKEWKVNDHIYLEANENYWKGTPSIDGVLITVVPDNDTRKMMFENGEIDLYDLDYAREQIPYYTESEEYKDRIISKPRLSTYYYSINENIEPFQDVRVRKAVQMAINRQEILDTLYASAGEVANGIFPPGLIAYNEELDEIPYDPEAAKELLEEAGYPDGFEMEITQTTDSTDTLSLNELVQSQLAEVGIKVTINQMDEATWLDVRSNGELPMYQTVWSADFNDPDNFIYTFFSPENTVARSFNYYNTEAMEKVVEARFMTDEDERIEAYQELEKEIIQDDAAWIPLFHLQHLWVKSERLKSYTPHWAGWSEANYWDVELDVSDAE